MDDWLRFELIEAPWLVRAIIEPPALPAVLSKLPRILFNNIHMLARAPANGVLRVTAGGKEFAFSVDLRNRQIIDTAAGHRNAGCYEPEVSRVLDRLLVGKAVFYDIGANFGYFALRAAMNPAFKGVVHAFEMSPRTFQDLVRTIAATRLSARVIAHNVGVSDVSGMQPFWEDQHSGRSKVLKSVRSRQRAVTRLDDCSLPPPDVMKLDVEGHEGAALAGATRKIAAALPAIVFESWTGSRDDRRPFDVLSAVGYRFFVPEIRRSDIRLRAISADARGAPGKRANVLAIADKHRSAIGDWLVS